MQGYGLQVCAVHGKKRGVQNVQEVGPGQFVCRPGMECQSSAPPQQPNYLPQQQHMGQMDLNVGYGMPNINSFGGMNSSLGGGVGGMGGVGLVGNMSGLVGGGLGNLGGGGLGGMGGLQQSLNPMGGGLVGGLNFAQLHSSGNSKQVCCIHRKERNASSLVEVAPGAKGLRCRPDDECKLGSSEEVRGITMYDCVLHGKKRSLNVLDAQEDGSYRCKADSECIKSVSNEKNMCCQHNKLRAVEVLQQESDGKWVCKPGSRCKGSGIARSPGIPYARPTYSGGSICSMCNKKRGSKYLIPHPTIPGALTCMPGNECK